MTPIDGIITGATPALAFRGLSYSGSSQYVRLTSFPRPTNLGISTWIKAPSTATSYRAIIDGDDDAAGTLRTWQFRLNNGIVEFIPFNASTYTALSASGFNLLDNAPHHVCVTYDGTSARIFIDGIERASTNALSGNLRSGTGHVFFGVHNYNNAPTQYYFLGEIGPSRIYNRALTPGEVRELFDEKPFIYAPW